MYLWRNIRFRSVPHTLIHDPKSITTDPMTMYLQWRRSWYDLGRSRYARVDQLTLWVRSNRRYLSPLYRYMRLPLPIASSCPSMGTMDPVYSALLLVQILKQQVILEQQTVLALLFQWRIVVSWSDHTLSKRDRSDRIVSRTVWNILSRIDRIKREWMDGWNRFKRYLSDIEGSLPLPES